MSNTKTITAGVLGSLCGLVLGYMLGLLAAGLDKEDEPNKKQPPVEFTAPRGERAGNEQPLPEIPALSGNKGVTVYSGTVTDTDGNAVEGAKLHILGPCMPSTVSGREGEYKIRWNPSKIIASREVWIIARHEERNLAAAVKAEPEHQDIILLPAITAIGTITDVDGKPIPNGSVSFGLTAPRGYISPFSENKRFAVNSQGGYEVRFIPPRNSYSVGFHAEGYKSKRIIVNTKDAIGGVLALDPFAMVALAKTDAMVSGEVVGPDGKPVSKVQVFRKGKIQPAGYKETDTNGKFTLNVCEGEVILSAVFRRDDGRVLTGWATVPSGTEGVRIVLKPRK